MQKVKGMCLRLQIKQRTNASFSVGPFLTITVLESSWYKRSGWRWVRGSQRTVSGFWARCIRDMGLTVRLCVSHPILDMMHSMHLVAIDVSGIEMVLEIQILSLPQLYLTTA